MTNPTKLDIAALEARAKMTLSMFVGPSSMSVSPFDVLRLIEAARERDALKAKPGPKIAPVQGYSPGIPWEMHLRAYDVYRKRYGDQKALIDLDGRNCRGGFSAGELDDFIPGWREELSEITTLRAERDSAIRALGEQGRQADRAQADADGLRGKLAVAEKALETIATTEPRQRCPSTHCERSQECRSPHECSGTGRGIAKRALAALRSPSPKEPTT